MGRAGQYANRPGSPRRKFSSIFPGGTPKRDREPQHVVKESDTHVIRSFFPGHPRETTNALIRTFTEII